MVFAPSPRFSPNSTDPYPLEADTVAKYFGDRLVLRSASLRAERGVITALLGRNGIGKSTLLRIMCGLISPHSGNVRISGVARASFTLAVLARHGIFFLPDRDLLHPLMSVRTQLETAATMRGNVADIERIAAMFGITERLDVRPHRLSGGELRRAEFAFALCCAPRVLVADEPLRGISPVDAETILTALRPVANDGCAIVLTGHEVNLILPHADRINWCVAGTTIQFASSVEAMVDPAFRKNFLPA